MVGIGALGCLLGAYLSDNAEVILIGHWPEQVAGISRSGLSIENADGRITHHTLTITDDPTSIGEVDVALVVVKSRQTLDAAHTVAKILKPDGLAITLQNGLNNCATLRSVLGASRVTLGVTSQGATVLGVAKIRHAGHGPTHFGRDPLLGLTQLEILPQVVDIFNQAGLESYLVDETDALVWGKLAVNAAINPLTALLRVPNGFLMQYEALVEIMNRAALEVAAVAEAQGDHFAVRRCGRTSTKRRSRDGHKPFIHAAGCGTWCADRSGGDMWRRGAHRPRNENFYTP